MGVVTGQERKSSWMNNVKLVLYGVIVTCFVTAGAIDIAQGNRKLGVVALLFALVNGIIFFWRQ